MIDENVSVKMIILHPRVRACARKLEVKYCLNCKKIVGCNDILEFLMKIGVQEEVVDKVRLSLIGICL
jgi:hypothetical protein